MHAACNVESSRKPIFARIRSPSIKDTYNRSPFIVAFQYGHTELKIFSKNEGTNKVEDSAESIKLKDLPLWSWVNMRRLRLLTEAISHGAGLDIRDPGAKDTLLLLGILLIANDSDKSIDRIKILRQLLRARNTFLDVRDMYGHIPARIAALEDFLQATEILVEHKVMLEELDCFGRPTLMIAFNFEISNVALALIIRRQRLTCPKLT